MWATFSGSKFCECYLVSFFHLWLPVLYCPAFSVLHFNRTINRMSRESKKVWINYVRTYLFSIGTCLFKCKKRETISGKNGYIVSCIFFLWKGPIWVWFIIFQIVKDGLNAFKSTFIIGHMTLWGENWDFFFCIQTSTSSKISRRGIFGYQPEIFRVTQLIFIESMLLSNPDNTFQKHFFISFLH